MVVGHRYAAAISLCGWEAIDLATGKVVLISQSKEEVMGKVDQLNSLQLVPNKGG